MPLSSSPPSAAYFTSETKASSPRKPIDMRRVATIILGGGQGSRLFPLTQSRCKPAMSFGGRYRLIDVPISNAINSGAHKIFILTQFLSGSLHQHILKTYRFGSFSSGFIELLAAEERPNQKAWFEGTADAVRKNLHYFAETVADYFLILSGDQLYHMDFREMVAFAQETDAQAVIASLPVTESMAKRMGVLHVNEDNFIKAFHEKPQTLSELKKLRIAQPLMNRMVKSELSPSHEYLGSMGIYLFKRQALIDLLSEDPREDFGKHLIPTQVAKGNIATYVFQGYWEDIGTIESFYRANIALTSRHPPFNCYNEEWSIYSAQNQLPGPRIYGTQMQNSILCEGSMIEAKEIKHSIVGPRTMIGKHSVIHDSYIIGNNYYAPPVPGTHLPEKFQIGCNCFIRSAIIDKHACIGNNVQLVNKNKVFQYDSSNLYVRDGIIIVPRGATLPDGFAF